MSFEVTENKNWVVFSVRGRLDAFYLEDFKAEMEKAVNGKHQKVALQLTDTQFLSFPIIKYFTGVASDLSEKGGQFALVGTPEKIKRQIDIFASLKLMQVFRSKEDWETIL